MKKIFNKLTPIFIFITIVVVIFFLFNFFFYEKQDISEKVQAYALTQDEIYTIQNSEEYKTIFENTDLYPKRMLEDLERNPEMLEFVNNYPTTDAAVYGGISEEEMQEKYPLFIQWDSRWGYSNYGTTNIGLSGCGPTCLAMVVYTFTRDESVTPNVIADYSMEQGYYVKDVGTSWQLLEDVAFQYGLSVEVLDYMDEKDLKNVFKQNGMIICSMGPGDFTDQGHFIVIRGYNKEGFLVNDPFSYTNSAKTWDYETLIRQIRKIWVYYSYS